MNIKLVRVSGNSLHPVILNGDYLITLKAPKICRIEAGDVIVFNHREYGMMVKAVREVHDGGMSFIVEGKNGLSIDSRYLGNVAMEDIIGKMIFHIPKK